MMLGIRYARLAVRRRSLAAAAAVAGLFTVTAAAQEKPASAGAESVETIVITGSRIATPNATSTSPIQTVTSQEITLHGATDVGNLLNTLPQVTFLSAVDLSNRSICIAALCRMPHTASRAYTTNAAFPILLLRFRWSPRRARHLSVIGEAA
jgi:hypothetical protein